MISGSCDLGPACPCSAAEALSCPCFREIMPVAAQPMTFRLVAGVLVGALIAVYAAGVFVICSGLGS